MRNHLMPLLKPKVSLTLFVIPIVASLFWLPLQSVDSSSVSSDETKSHSSHTSKCVGEEIQFDNKEKERACVTVVHKRLEFSEAERACVNAQYSANLPIFVDHEDADNFTTHMVNRNGSKLSFDQPFFVAYETQYKSLANEFGVDSASFKCFVPTLMTHDETEKAKKHHYVSVDGTKKEQKYCSDYEDNPRNYEDDVTAAQDANDAGILECVQVQAEAAVVGLNFNNALFSRADCSQPAQVVCVRWLLEFECEAPPEISNLEAEESFLDGESRFFFDEVEKVCYRYDCNKDNVKKQETTCKAANECYGVDREEMCLPGLAPVTKSPIKIPETKESGGSPRSVLSESTIWVVICGVLAVLILLILLVIYLVNQKDECDSAASMNPYRTIHEYWRSNRRNSRLAIGDDEPVEAAYSAYSIYDESLSDTSSLQLAGGYGDVIRRTVSTGATGSGPAYLGASGVPGDISQASSTCNVTGEPPPMYNDEFHYKRKQQRMNSTNSINSAGEYAPPYTSRPVSAASSFMSLGGPGTGLPGSQFASNNDIHKPISNGSTCQIFQDSAIRGRNPSGKKVKFSPHPNPPCPGPKDRHRHVSDLDPSTARKRHLSDLPILSNSAGGAMMHNAMANMQPPAGPRSSNQLTGAPKDLKPALRIRHRSEEQSSTASQLASSGTAGNGSALPTIQPPPQHPGSRLLRTATSGSGGNLLSGSSRSILNEISGANLTSNGTSQQASKGTAVPTGGVARTHIKPNSGFDTSVRQRHVSADQTWSGRKRKDSDLIGLLDDQSPLILTPGSDGNSKNVTLNPFLFNKDGKMSNQTLQKQQNRPIGFRNNSNSQIAPSPLNVSSSANALTVRSPHQEFPAGQSLVPSQPPSGALKQQQQRFSDQDLTDTASGSNSGGVRPRSRSVTDQNRQFNPMNTETNTGKETEKKTNDPVTFKLGFLGKGGSGSRSSISSSSERNGSTSVGPPKQGAVNASYEDESMC